MTPARTGEFSPLPTSPRLGVETLPDTSRDTAEKLKSAFEKNWNVIVWNDPINLMSYVVFVFMRVLGFTREKATKHMLQVHREGKSLVATETREKAELYHQQMQSFGLTVTIERAES
jgi:ATP-dependent Clp protease adaptor protein ClpS